MERANAARPFPRATLISGDEDPFPWSVPPGNDQFPKGVTNGRWTWGKASYLAFQVGPFVELVASGTAQANTAVRLALDVTEGTSPRFGLFFFVPPKLLPAKKLFSAIASFYAEKHVESVSVWDAEGKQQVRVFPDQSIGMR
ncbi:MAG TPA: hypothetical protein VKT73_02605 [Xanthobacteraceae bacterium]|nr:hypothetical protein [Xanthobacteraceae bacterium]